MSYNLTYNVLSPIHIKKLSEIERFNFNGFVLFNQDAIVSPLIKVDASSPFYVFNLNDYASSQKDIDAFNILFNKLASRFKDFVFEVDVQTYDFDHELSLYTKTPGNYIRYINNSDQSDAIYYMSKDFISRHPLDYENKFAENECVLGEDLIVFYLHKGMKTIDSKLNVIAFKEGLGEYVASIFDRNDYHHYLPSPLCDSVWDFHFVTEYDELEKIKSYPDLEKQKILNFLI